MMWVVWLLLAAALCSICIFRLLAWFIIWFSWHKYSINIGINSVGFFIFKNIKIIDKKGNRINIESLWCSSSLFNNEVQKLVCFCLSGVHFFKQNGGEKEETEAEPKPEVEKKPKISTSSFLILQNVGVVIHDLELHSRTTLLQWDLIFSNFRVNLAHCERLYNLELAISHITLHGRDTNDQLIFALSSMVKFNILLSKNDAKGLVHDLDVRIERPRGFMKEEVLTLLGDEKSRNKSKVKPKIGAKTKVPWWIPGSANLDVSDSYFTVSRGDDCRNLTLLCQKLASNMIYNRNHTNIRTSFTTEVNSFEVTGVEGHLLSLENAALSAKSDHQTASVSLKLVKPSVEYHHNEVLYWLTVFASLKSEKSEQPGDEKESVMKRYLSSRTVTCTADLNDGSASLPIEDSGFNSKLRYCKLRLDLKPKVDNESEKEFKMEAFKGEIVLDNVSCQLIGREKDLERNLHHWGTIFYLGTFSSKVERTNSNLTVNPTVDSTRFEWSTVAVETAIALLKSFRISPPRASAIPKSRDHKEPLEIQIIGTITNVNVFVTNHYKHYLMFRIDKIASDFEQCNHIVHVNGCKIVHSRQRSKPYNIVSALDIKDYVGFIMEMKNLVNLKDCIFSVNVLEDVHFRWTTTFQMMLYHLQKDTTELKDAIRVYRNQQEVVKTESKKKEFTLEVKIKGAVTLNAQLSRDHCITSEFNQSQFLYDSGGNMEISTQMMTVDCDEHEVFLVQEFCASSADQSEDFDSERQIFENLETRTNKAWLISLGKLGIIFPYKYNFALCWERLMRTRKLLKKLHTNPLKKKTNRLPPDLGLKFKSIHIQIDDDPFEVKLGDNFALLVDEHREGEKRTTAMDRRINELRKKHGLLPTGKVDELYASLNQKNSTIYVKRSMRQYTEHPMRSSLFQWKMEDLEVYLLADESLNSEAKCVDHMRDIDNESPIPENLKFNTLFGRMLNASVGYWTVQLRDYSQPMLDVQEMHMWGRLIVGEPMGTSRARYQVTVEVADPFDDVTIDKNMPNPKFYHDLSCDVKSLIMAHGACWEPVMAQYNQSMDLINKPSMDPSKPMPFWDKIRLRYHGRLTMSMQEMSWLYHTSLDPFNSTEFMDWTWTNLVFDWTNGKFVLKGDLDVYLRTASKYDDCRFLHLPNLTFGVGLDWLCHGDKNDHHSVMPCHPDKVPEFSLQEHDSYRAFRSQKVNMSLSMETKRCQDEEGFEDMPCCLSYASTARFLEKIKMCIARVSRPIKRGAYYHTKKPKKTPLSRHYSHISVQLKFTNPFLVCYWASFAKQYGLELAGNSFTLDGVFRLDMLSQDGPLIRRNIASWSVVRLGMDLDRARTWVCSKDDEADEANTSMRSPIIRSFLFSIRQLRYTRDEPLEPVQVLTDDDKSLHQVDINDLKGAWTTRNRNIMIILYDGYSKASALRRALSSDALKGYKTDGRKTPLKKTLNTSLPSLATPSPLTRLQSGHAISLLQKLVSETESKFVAFAEEPSVGNNREQLHGVASCQTGDVIKRKWAIDLHNSQVIMRGIETAGYVIVSASRAQILSCEHRAVWHDQQLKTKTTWVGSLECMQYYSTVTKQPDDDMYWLTEENVVLNCDDSSRIPEMAGCGQSVGGVVTTTVDTEGNEYKDVVQLQRIISRCRCQFFYASYGEADPTNLSEVPPIPQTSSSELERSLDEGVDSLTLLHHDLNICTNSNQYHIMLDIVNNLLLYVEPKKKIYTEKVQAMRFKLELSSIDDQRTPILALQEKLRHQILTMRSVERELYMTHRRLDDDSLNMSLIDESDHLEKRLNVMKEQISNDGEDLGIMISGFIARQLEMETRQKYSTRKATPTLVSRRNEVCFKHAQWRLTGKDGQIGIADLVLRNFLYVKTNNNDDSGSHLVELGWAKMQNLLPNTIYKEVLMPQDIGKGKLDDVAMRIVCRVRPPVGGISVKEHLEINLVPVQIQLTKQFYREMMDFFFPGETQDETDDTTSVVSVESSATSHDSKSTTKEDSKKDEPKSSFKSYVELPDDVDKMKERAARNNTFLHVKIPELPLRISYKGERDKNVTDVHDMPIRLPALEIHNQTWTWLDLLMSVKNNSKRALLSQAIKQKLHMPRRFGDDTVTDVQQEEDKAKMLLGAKLVAGNVDNSKSKKSLFGKTKMK